MHRVAATGLTLIIVATAWAQPSDSIPVEAMGDGARLNREDRVRYLLRQVDLTEDQAGEAEALIARFFVGGREDGLTPEDVTELWRELEMEKAKAEPDLELISETRDRLEEIARGLDVTSGFLHKFRPKLTPEQRSVLDAATERLKRVPSGAVRPIDLLRAAVDIGLSDEQQARLPAVQARVTKRYGPQLQPSSELKAKAVNICADELREILTPEQRERFELAICRLRPDRVDQGLLVKLP